MGMSERLRDMSLIGGHSIQTDPVFNSLGEDCLFVLRKRRAAIHIGWVHLKYQVLQSGKL